MGTIKDFLVNATQDDEYLLRFILKKTQAELLGNLSKQLTTRAVERFRELKKQRARGVPMQYIVGEAWFYGLKFKVTPSVLIPRPETELMVDRILAIIAEHKKCSVIDVGTGSGAVAIAVAKNSSVPVVGIDVSHKALVIARSNARLHKARVKFFTDNAKKMSLRSNSPHAIIAANLPYLSDARMKKLSREVKQEPKLALYGGRDGLDFYRALVPTLFKNKFPHQKITALFEIDPEQKTKLASFVARELPIYQLIFHRDLHGDIRLAEITF